jgi:hypothetical protein
LAKTLRVRIEDLLEEAVGRIGVCATATSQRRAAPSSRVGGARDVLTWIVLGLTAWLAIGVLAATLFGALVTTSE